MIVLNRTEIEALIDYNRAAQAIEEAFRAVNQDRVNLPPVGHITFPTVGGDCHIKYGHIQGDPIFVIKVATGFPANTRLGLPNGNGATLVLSSETGEVKALLHDEMLMTDIRTGIAGAIASKLLACKASRHVLIVGTGTQAVRQIEAHRSLLGQHLNFCIWGRSESKAAQIVDNMAEKVAITLVTNLEAACREADIIVTTTAATSPLVRDAWIKPGTHITAIGADAPGKHELDRELLTRADIHVCDLASQSLDHGEFASSHAAGDIDASQVVEIGNLLIDPTIGRKNDTDITIADLTGLAAQDIAIANVVLSAWDARAR